MGSEITLSSAVRSNLLSLQNTADLLGKTQERLATGKKVNSALDDPTAFFTASSLNSRASDLSRLQDFVGNAVQTIKAADEGITALTNLVETAEATARQALQSAGNTAVVTGTDDLSGIADLGATIGAIDDTVTSFTVQVGTASAVTITIADGDGIDDLLADINAVSDVTASLTSDGYLQIEATNGEDLILADGAGTPLADGGLGLAVGTTAAAENTDRTAFATQFDDLRTQIDQLVQDAGFNGVNLLNGDSLTVTFNEDGTSTLGITGVTFDSTGLSIAASTDTFQKDSDINTALSNTKSAIATLRSQASNFGSHMSVLETRQDFTKSLINVLETGAANLTLADTNEEGCEPTGPANPSAIVIYCFLPSLTSRSERPEIVQLGTNSVIPG